MDIFVTNDKLDNSLFHNKGGGKFEEVAFETGVALARETASSFPEWGSTSATSTTTAIPDIAFVALDNETFPLFRNLGKGGFRRYHPGQRHGPRSARPWRATLPPSPISTTMAGRTSSSRAATCSRWDMRPSVQVEQPNTVFRNLGGAKFQALTAEAGLTAQPPSRHRGSAVGDLNGDGRLDVVVTALGAPAEIWMNDSPGGQSLDRVPVAGHAEQSRRHRGADQSGGRRGCAVQPGVFRGRLRLVERRSGAFRTGSGQIGRPGGDPLAFGHDAGTQERGRRTGWSRSRSRRSSGKKNRPAAPSAGPPAGRGRWVRRPRTFPGDAGRRRAGSKRTRPDLWPGRAVLERQLRSELDVPRIVSVGDLAEVTGTVRRAHRAPLGVVEGIEGLYADLELAAARLAKREVLEKRHVPVVASRTVDAVLGEVAPLARRGIREAGGGEPATSQRLRIANRAGEVRAGWSRGPYLLRPLAL